MCIDITKRYRATVETSRGAFTLDLDPTIAPIAVNNFVVLARYHYYEGATFSRVVSGYVVQGGERPGTDGENPGYAIPDELPGDRSAYQPGALAMASDAPNSSGSQFFIVVANKGIAPRFTIFGKVAEGLDTTVAAIDGTGSPTGQPSATTTITKVEVIESSP